MFIFTQVTTTVCAKSGDPVKSYSKRGNRHLCRCSVTILGTPGAVVSKLVFIPKSEKMYLTTESPCFEPSIKPSNLTTASESSANAMISYQ